MSYPHTCLAGCSGNRLLAVIAVVTVAAVCQSAAAQSSPGPDLQAAPAPSSRIPVRILAETPERSSALGAALGHALPGVDAIGPGGVARFTIELNNAQCRVFGAGGVEEIARFDGSDNAALVTGLSHLLSRYASLAELLGLDNPSSGIRLEVRLSRSGALPPGEAPETRGVQVQENPRVAEYRIRREGDPRTPENSLQFDVRASADVYLTIADFDAEGGVNLLFPNSAQGENFYPLGLIPGGQTVRIPDSLAPGNRAAFNLDLSPPAGADTIRVFASKNRETAQLIRDLIQQAGTSTANRSAAASLRALQEKLAEAAATRGLVHDAASGQTPVSEGDWAAASISISVKD